MTTECDQHLTLWNLGSQQILLDFPGGRIVSAAGLLTIRALERPLQVMAGLAERLPDPRSLKYRHHATAALLTQQVYQILAGYPDPNDADPLRDDPLFQILADLAPDAERPLASGSTRARFPYAFTRRQAELPLEERPVWLAVRAAPCQRIKILNQYLVELFVRTRRTPPAAIVLDGDATDDPTHGGQTLSGYHGYFERHPYVPLLVYDGVTGFPLAAWLRPGTVHASCGATDVLRPIVAALRAAWPDVRILARADNGLAVPAVYDSCEQERLEYALGQATKAVLQRATAAALADVELYYRFYGYRDPQGQRFEELRDYPADSWPQPRRVIAKIEINPKGSQRRFVATNRTDSPASVQRDCYVQRGAVPEQPMGEMKNGLQADRLSSSGFCANSLRLLVPTLAYAIGVLFREATAAVPEVAKATVSRLRQRLWKVGAALVTTPRRIWLHVSETWPNRGLWQRVQAAVGTLVEQLGRSWLFVPQVAGSLPT